jgi:hypothetical protein
VIIAGRNALGLPPAGRLVYESYFRQNGSVLPETAIISSETGAAFLTEGPVPVSLTVFFLREIFQLCLSEPFNLTTGVEPRPTGSVQEWPRRLAGSSLSDAALRAAAV